MSRSLDLLTDCINDYTSRNSLDVAQILCSVKPVNPKNVKGEVPCFIITLELFRETTNEILQSEVSKLIKQDYFADDHNPQAGVDILMDELVEQLNQRPVERMSIEEYEENDRAVEAYIAHLRTENN